MLSTLANKRGFTLISIVIGSVIFICSLLAYSSTSLYSRKSLKNLNETLVAEMYAAELLEFFRSMSCSQLQNHLNINPSVPQCTNPGFRLANPALCSPYYLCSQINILNRTTGIISNPDGLAELPAMALDNPVGGNPTKPNRFYMLQVVTLFGNQVSPVPQVCSPGGPNPLRPDQICCKGQVGCPYVLGTDNSRFLVTVGVSWVPKLNTISKVKRVVLTTILPDDQ